MFHLELRQFPHVAREFNLSGEALHSRFVEAWTAGSMVTLGDRRWAPERARMTIFEGEELPSEEMGLGRGWSKITKSARDVTEEVLSRAARGSHAISAVEDLKLIVLAACGPAGLGFPEVIALAAAQAETWRASDQLALAEQAVWELLHHGRVRLVRGGAPVDAEDWRAILLRFDTWSGAAPDPPTLGAW